MGWLLDQTATFLSRFLISQHPEVEAKITAELDSLGLLVGPSRPKPREMEYADLSKLTYLSAAIKAGPIHVLYPAPSCSSSCFLKQGGSENCACAGVNAADGRGGRWCRARDKKANAVGSLHYPKEHNDMGASPGTADKLCPVAAAGQVHAGESRLQPCIHAAAGLLILHILPAHPSSSSVQLLLQFHPAEIVCNDAIWRGCCLSYCLVKPGAVA